MPRDSWRTYTPEQASQVMSAVHYLLESDVLDEDEIKVARSLAENLKGAVEGIGGEKTLIYMSKAQDELIQQVEDTLWR